MSLARRTYHRKAKAQHQLFPAQNSPKSNIGLSLRMLWYFFALVNFLPRVAADSVTEFYMDSATNTSYRFGYDPNTVMWLKFKLPDDCNALDSNNTLGNYTSLDPLYCYINGQRSGMIDFAIEAGKNASIDFMDCLFRIMNSVCTPLFPPNPPAPGDNSGFSDAEKTFIIFGISALLIAVCCGASCARSNRSGYSSMA